MLEKIKRKKGLVILISILVVLLLILAVIAIINMSKETKEVMQETVEIGKQEKTEIITTNRQQINSEEPPPNVEQIEEKEEPEVEQKKQEIKYYIKVNNQANVVTIYTKDKNGNYTVPYKAMICSIGKATPTEGVYTIPGKTWDRWTWGQMEGGVWAQYYVRIKGSILFHSVPYTSKDKSTLEYWEYDKLGTKASAGCIRLTVRDAKWIYDNCPAGTQVEFYYDSNPGPLGKPSAQKISGEESVRGWDPTDPASGNPWKNYTPTPQAQPEQPPVIQEPIEQPDQPVVEEPITPPEQGEEENPEDKPEEKPEESEPEEDKPEETQPPKEEETPEQNTSEENEKKETI